MVMEEQESDMELDSERVPVPQVQNSKEDSRVETNNKVTSASRGKPRLRKKALHAAILKQMEFYFSDANISKDRFLGNLIKENPYVDLNIFIRFNKIRELTTDTGRIAKALHSSTMLSLSEDGTKVRRLTPIRQKENTDECTIYVQNLPPDADHEMLSSIFSQYGPVAYVSIPKYKSNKKIKGFAFVEFDKPDDARKCLKSFQKKGCVLPSHTSPDHLLSITTFDDAEKDVTLCGRSNKMENNTLADVKKMEMQEESETTEETDKNVNAQKNQSETLESNTECVESKQAKKRKHKDSESSETAAKTETSDIDKQAGNEVPEAKKMKCKNSTDDHSVKDKDKCENIDANEEPNISIDKQSDSIAIESTEKSNKCKTSENEEMSDACNKTDDNADAGEGSTMKGTKEEQDNVNDDKKKKRKRKRKSKMDDISYNMGLQVMAKRDWKDLRNKYLELQRSKMKQLKQHLKKTRWNQWSNYEKNKLEKEENEQKEKTVKSDSTGMRFSYTPGVIVKIELDKPCTDPKSLKIELRGHNSIKYIDVDEGAFHAYVRCDTTEGAQSFAQKSNEERQMTILEGEEEQSYWGKISQDREEKLGKKIRVKQRGRNKLLKKAEKELGKHIKFDEV